MINDLNEISSFTSDAFSWLIGQFIGVFKLNQDSLDYITQKQDSIKIQKPYLGWLINYAITYDIKSRFIFNFHLKLQSKALKRQSKLNHIPWSFEQTIDVLHTGNNRIQLTLHSLI